MQKRNLIPMDAGLVRAGCRYTKMYELIDAGHVLAYKQGGQTMIDADSIDAYHASLPQIMPKKKPKG